MASEENRAQAIFEESVDLSTGDRTAFIDEACGGDETLKQRVLSLLEYSSDDDDDLASVAGLSNTPDELIGTNIGKFMIKSLLGEGGFGAVYLAEQHDPVKRQVAIKIIKLGMDSKSIVARFQSERQALAHMNHPGIARIIQAGTTSSPLIFSQLDRDGDGVITPDEWQAAWDEIDVNKDGSISAAEWQSANRWGRPYFVMEYVPGESITDYCEIHSFDINERIAIFQQACAAIQHAHSRGIIHRDIKPSNVLVTSTPEGPRVKVIDFGIAKALSARIEDATFITHEGQIVGTPEFMSPEQCLSGSHDIGTATDIYSLGVLLYELLTGHRPFDSKTLRSGNLVEIQRIICEDTPSKPSTRFRELSSQRGELQATPLDASRLNVKSHYKSLCGDLDWIIMKCLEKDPERRYLTAIALSEDLDRYIENRPVHAAAPGWQYRFKKFAKRKSGLLVACALIAFALIGGIAASGYFAIEANTRANEAQAFSQAATDSRDEAVKAKDQAEQKEQEATILNSRLATLISFLSNGLVRGGNPIDDNKGFDLKRIKLWIDEAARVAQAELYQNGTLEEADIRTFIGSLYRKFGFDSEAFNQFSIALEIRKNLLGEQDIDTLWQAAIVMHSSGRLETGGMSAGEYSRYYKLVMDNLDRVIDAQTERSRELLVICLNEAIEKMPWLVDVLIPKAIQSVQSANVGYNVNLGVMFLVRGTRNGQLGNHKSQLEDYQAGLAQLRASLGERNPETLTMHWRLGECLIRNGDFRQGIEHFEIAYRGFMETHGGTYWQTGYVGKWLASVLIDDGRFEEAEEYLLVPFVACLNKLGIDHELTQSSALYLAGLYSAWGRPQEVQKYQDMLLNKEPASADPAEEPAH